MKKKSTGLPIAPTLEDALGAIGLEVSQNPKSNLGVIVGNLRRLMEQEKSSIVFSPGQLALFPHDGEGGVEIVKAKGIGGFNSVHLTKRDLAALKELFA